MVDPIGGGEENPAHPRAFVIGTGRVFLTVGSIYLFGACCFWSFSGRIIEPVEAPPLHWLAHLRGEHLPAAALTLGVATTLIGGVGMIGMAIGLQNEKRGSGRAAAVLTGVMGLVYWTLTGLLVPRTDAWPHCITTACFAIVTTALFLLARHSHRVLRNFPPPDDRNVVTDDELRDYRRQ